MIYPSPLRTRKYWHSVCVDAGDALLVGNLANELHDSLHFSFLILHMNIYTIFTSEAKRCRQRLTCYHEGKCYVKPARKFTGGVSLSWRKLDSDAVCNSIG